MNHSFSQQDDELSSGWVVASPREASFFSFMFLPLPYRLFFFFSLILLSGCTSKQKFISPYEEPNRSGLMVQSFSDVERLTAVRAPDRPLFWAKTDIRLEQQIPVSPTKTKTKRYRFDALLLYGEPDRMRVRGNHFLAGTLFEVILEGEKAGVFLNKERQFFQGSLPELQQVGGIFGSFSPDELVGALRVNHRLKNLMEQDPARIRWSTTETADYLYVIYQETERTFVWKIRREDGLVEEVLISNPREKNAIQLRILYSGYELLAPDEPYPTEMEFSVPGGEFSLKLNVEEIKLEPPLNPGVITSEPRNIEQRLPLAALFDVEPVLPAEETADP